MIKRCMSIASLEQYTAASLCINILWLINEMINIILSMANVANIQLLIVQNDIMIEFKNYSVI